jgi:hypothetical protein
VPDHFARSGPGKFEREVFRHRDARCSEIDALLGVEFADRAADFEIDFTVTNLPVGGGSSWTISEKSSKNTVFSLGTNSILADLRSGWVVPDCASKDWASKEETRAARRTPRKTVFFIKE